MTNRSRRRWRLYVLSICLPFVFLAIIDLGLRAAGIEAPEDPLLFHLRTHDLNFSPFVDGAEGFVSIRPDWISRGDALRETRGTREGRYFLYPGFRPSRFQRNKEAGAIRIFALGGSSTFGLHAGQNHAFAALLGTRLGQVLPNRRVEMINLGCPGWASGHVRNVLDAVLELDPDLLIIYCGHNEMLEGHVVSRPKLGWLGWVRATLISNSTLAGWLNHAITARSRARWLEMVSEETAALEAGRIPTYDPQGLPDDQQRRPDQHFFDMAAARFAANLEAMIDRTHTAAVPVIFVLPVRNLLLPPSISAYDQDAARANERASLVRRAQQMLTQGRVEDGLNLLDAATELSPDHAKTRYLRGTALMRLGRRPEAESDLRMACDLDVRTHRITSQLEDALIGAVKGSNGTWIDLRPQFQGDLNVASAKKLFFDHVHPTRSGHRIIARRLLPRVLDDLEINGAAAAAVGVEAGRP